MRFEFRGARHVAMALEAMSAAQVRRKGSASDPEEKDGSSGKEN